MGEGTACVWVESSNYSGRSLWHLPPPAHGRLYESWVVQDSCDVGSLADIVSASSSSTGSDTTSGAGGGNRLARLRSSCCCSPDPEQRMLSDLLCLLDVASGLDYLHTCCNMVGAGGCAALCGPCLAESARGRAAHPAAPTTLVLSASSARRCTAT